MKKKIYLLTSLFVLITTFSSCLSGDDDTEVVYYNDTAITSVTLGTMTRTLHTTSSKGEDSIYTVAYSGSKYPMYIDQTRNIIYNADSLPANTKKTMMITVSALNTSYVYVKSLTSDSLVACNGSDSIDFSQPRVLKVFASDGNTHRDYVMEVRIHNEEAGVFAWQQRKSSDALASLADMRGLSVGETLYVLGVRDGSSTKAVYTSNISDGENWTLASETLAADADVVADDNSLYALSNGQIFMSADGASWIEIATAASLRKLMAATGNRLYALDANGLVVSEDNGKTWCADALDDDASYLPTEDVNAVLVNQRTNSDLKKLFLVGRRDTTLYSDNKAVVWSHIEGETNVAEQQPWMHQNFGREYKYVAPALNHLTVVPYNGAMLLIGGAGTGTCTMDALDRMLCSYDQGLTWKTSDTLTLPAGLSSNASSFAMIADKNDYLWIIAGTSGQVWRGTISDLQWGK